MNKNLIKVFNKLCTFFMPCPTTPFCLHLSAPGCPWICITYPSRSKKEGCLLSIVLKESFIGSLKGKSTNTSLMCTVFLGRKELTSGRLKVGGSMHKAEYCCCWLIRVRKVSNVERVRHWQRYWTLWRIIALSCTLPIIVGNTTLSESWTHWRNWYQDFCPFELC